MGDSKLAIAQVMFDIKTSSHLIMKFTLKIYMQYAMYFACNGDLCRAVLTNLLGDISSAFTTVEPYRRHLRRVTTAKGMGVTAIKP